MGKRIFIYRSGDTSNFALTGSKEDPRLPHPDAPGVWLFWMQIGPLQSEHRGYGFDLSAAVKEISTNGYHLFTGSQILLGKRPLARPKPATQEAQDDA